MRAIFRTFKKNIKRNCKAKSKSDGTAQFLLALGSAVLFAIFLWGGLGLRKLSTTYSFSQYMPKQHELLKLQSVANSRFQSEAQNPFLLVLEWNESWLTPNAMKKLKSISDRVSRLKGVSRVSSLSTVEGAVESQGQLAVGPIFENLPVDQWKSYVASHDLLNGQLISEDQKSVLLLVEPTKMTSRQLRELSNRISMVSHQMLPLGTSFLGGAPEVQLRFTELLKSDLILFVTLSFLVFSLMFFILFKGWSALGLTVVSLLFSNVLCLGLLAHLHISIDILLSTMPIVISVSVLSIMIHSFHRWAEVNDSDLAWNTRYRLSLRTIREMFRGNLLGSMTTALGFLALITTNVPAIKQYGVVIAASICLAWMATQLVLLVGLHITRPALRSWSKGKAHWTQFVTRRPILFIASGLFLATVGLGNAYRLHFGSRIFDDLASSEPARENTEFVDAQFGGDVSYDLTLTEASGDYWKKAARIHHLQNLIVGWKQKSEIGSILSLDSILQGAHARRDADIAETLFLFSMSANDPANTFLTDDGRSLRIRFRFHDVDSQWIADDFLKIKEDISRTFPGVKIEESGIGHVTHSINREVSQELVFGFWQSLVLIGLLLIVVFRSWRYALVACLPNLIPPLVLVGFMALHQTNIKPGIAIIFSITLGVAFNNTVYILSRLKNKLSRNPNAVESSSKPRSERYASALRRTLLQEGNPCLFETMMMVGGFGLFLLSRFQMNQMFGGYMILSILSGAFGDLVVLPAILKRWGPEILEGAVESQIPNVVTLPVRKTAMSFRSAASFLLPLMVAVVLLPRIASADTVSEILGRVHKNIEAHDDNSVVEMTIIEANGSKKLRKLNIETLQDVKFHALAQVVTPADVRGTKVLSEVDKDHENQWLYTPSNRQVRRLMSVKHGNGVLGSEITMDDMNSTAIKSIHSKILQRNQDRIEIELTPKAGTSIYDRTILTLSAKLEVPLKTQYFKSGKNIKTVEFKDYKKFGAIYRAQCIVVKNTVNHRGTELSLVSYHPNPGLTIASFNPSKLKDN